MRNPGAGSTNSSNINIIGSSMKNSASLADLSKSPALSSGGPLKHSNLAMYQKKPRYAAGSILTQSSNNTNGGP